MERQKKRAALTSYFEKVFAPGSVPGGIINAVRPNTSLDWNETEDVKRSDATVDADVKDFHEAVVLLAGRK